jgi:hypothetical protein
MGMHNRRTALRIGKKTKTFEPKTLPKNVGKRRRIKTIFGDKRYFIIEDEILHHQHNANHKLIAFQRIKFEADNRIEYRFGYYMKGVKSGAKGRWVWGQFCLFIPEKDLKEVLIKAKRKGWF